MRHPLGARSIHAATAALALVVHAVAAPGASAGTPPYDFPEPRGAPERRTYVCYRATEAVVPDGLLSEPSWRAVPWTMDFVDIEGDLRSAPRFRTRAKMLWDERCFYIGAEMEEPDVWATLTTRDAVIFHDNDFEVFIDPDGDNHEYYELEVNALGTEWDLLLTKPYRDNGTAIDSWDIQGLITGVAVDGTLNMPGDVDTGWSVEIAIPWSVLEECAHGPSPPEAGDTWRVNFSRVEWQVEAAGGRYAKLTDPESGRPLYEDNWVWSPQGLVNMHYPEMWGLVQFSQAAAGAAMVEFVPPPNLDAARALMILYYKQRTQFANTGAYAADVSDLGLSEPPGDGFSWPPDIHVTPNTFEASLVAEDGTVMHITQDSHLW